jgi:hypothetical protein
MGPNCIIAKLVLDKENFLIIDGVKIGRLIMCDGDPVIEFCDKNPNRSADRGSRLVGVRIKDLLRFSDSEGPPEDLLSAKFHA